MQSVGGGGDDADSVFSSQELRTELHHQTEDGPEGKKKKGPVH